MFPGRFTNLVSNMLHPQRLFHPLVFPRIFSVLYISMYIRVFTFIPRNLGKSYAHPLFPTPSDILRNRFLHKRVYQNYQRLISLSLHWMIELRPLSYHLCMYLILRLCLLLLNTLNQQEAL